MSRVDSQVPFLDFCDLCENIKSANFQNKIKLLSNFLADYRRKGNSIKDVTNKFLYPVLRLLLPNVERERGPYNLKEFAFAKTLKNIFCLDPNGSDVKLLSNYKMSGNEAIRDFCDAAYFVLQKKFSNSSQLSINDVNKHLDTIAGFAGNDIRAQENAILKLFNLTSALEQKWIIRIILKELKLGLGLEKILNIFHKDACNLFNSNSSLYETCKVLHDPKTSLNNIEISLFSPFRPMLSLRCDKKEMNKSVKEDKIYYLENKFDGERFQMHFNNGEFKYFSRNGFDYTEDYGSTYRTQGFTKNLVGVLKDHVTSLILDGEMMVWNKKTREFGSKGMNVDVKKLKPNNVHQPCFCVFDILLLNDKVLCNEPLNKRKELLKTILNPKEGTILISAYQRVQNKKEILDALNECVVKKEEGVVFKEENSFYHPNERKGWWKLKLEYFEGVMSDLDVIIMGGYYGVGYQKNQITGFLVGLIDKDNGKYLSLAKISTGLDKSEQKELDNKLTKHWKKVEGDGHENHNLFWGKEVPDVWIQPEQSCCLTVRGSELIRMNSSNPDYKTTYTLRFPRILSIRLDKPYYDCLTLTEFNDLRDSNMAVEKLNKRPLDLTDLEIVPVKKVRKNQLPERVVVEEKSDVLEGYEFLVLSGKEKWTKDLVEIVIREHGGKVVKAEGENTLCMLAGEKHCRVNTYKGDIDIVNIDWLRSVLNENEFSMYTPHDMLYTSPKTKKLFMRNFDKFGDPYYEDATKSSIKKIVNKVFTAEFLKDNYVNLMVSEIKAFHREFNFDDAQKPFRGISAYFDKYKVINNENSSRLNLSLIDELDFKHKGGVVCPHLSKSVIYIVTNLRDPDRVSEVEAYLKSIVHEKAHIVGHPDEILQIQEPNNNFNVI